MADVKPGISIAVALDSAQFDQRLTASGERLRGFGQQAQRLSGTMRWRFGNVGLQVQDLAVQIGGGTSALRALAQQLPQLASGFGPVGIAVGTVTGLALSLGAAFVNTRDTAQQTADALKDLKIGLDDQVESVDKAITKYRELTEAQRANAQLNLTAELQAAETAQSGLNEELRKTVLEFGQVGAAEAGILEGSGRITELIAGFRSGRIGATEFATGIAELRDTVGEGNAAFVQFSDNTRETANNLLKAELSAEQTRNRMKALNEIAKGNTKTHEEVAKAADDQAKAHDRAAKAAGKLAGEQQKLTETVRFDVEGDRRLKQFQSMGANAKRIEEAGREQTRAAEQANREMLRGQETLTEAVAGPQAEASPATQRAMLARLHEAFS